MKKENSQTLIPQSLLSLASWLIWIFQIIALLFNADAWINVYTSHPSWIGIDWQNGSRWGVLGAWVLIEWTQNMVELFVQHRNLRDRESLLYLLKKKRGFKQFMLWIFFPHVQLLHWFKKHKEAELSPLPLIWWPLGRTLRILVIYGPTLFLVGLKLSLYFCYLTLWSVFWKYSTGAWIDRLDKIMGWFEMKWVGIYNKLYYVKIYPRSGIFSVMFNGILPLWCLNH